MKTTMKTMTMLLSLLFTLFAAAATPPEKLDVTFIVTADTHIVHGAAYAQTHPLALSAMKDAKSGQRLTWPKGMIDEGQPIPQPAAVFIAGDLSYDGLLRPTYREWELFRKLYLDRTTSLLKMPVYPGGGNHDIWAHINQYQVGGADVVNWGVSSLIAKSWEGSPVFKFAPAVSTGWWYPPHYAVGLGDGRLLVVQLNTSIGEPCRSGTKAGNHGTYLEATDPQCDAFAWLRNVLAEHRTKFGDDAPVILVQHMGYDAYGAGTNDYAYRGYWWAPEYRRQLAETIAPYHVVAFIHGHTHVPYYVKPGTTYSNDSFGADLSSPPLLAGDDTGRAWTNIIDNVPEYCRALSTTGQVRCTQAGGSGAEVTSGAFDLGDKLGRGWINVEADIKPDKKYADYCRVLAGSHKIACNRRGASAFIGDTAILDTKDAGWPDSRVWVKLSPSIPAAFCRVTGSNTIRCTPYAHGTWGKEIIATGIQIGTPETRRWVDFNNDGKIDFCRTIGSGKVSCRVSDANGFFQKEVTSGTIDTGYGTGLGWVDVNLDGYLDFCRVTDSNTAIGALRCLLTDAASGGFSAKEIASPIDYSSPGIVGFGFDVGYNEGRTWADFNGDKRPDYCRVVEANKGRGRIECALANGGRIGPSIRSLYLDPGELAGRAFLDVNGDGRADYCRIAGGRAVCTLATVATTTVPVHSFSVASGFCNPTDNSVAGYTVFRLTEGKLQAVEVKTASTCDQPGYNGAVVAGTTYSIDIRR